MSESSQQESWKYPWCRVLAWLLPAMVLLICADRTATSVLQWIGWVLLGLAAVSDKSGHRDARVGVTVSLWLVAMGGVAAGAFIGDDVGDVFKGLFRYLVPVIWLALAWVASPVFVGRGAGQGMSVGAVWCCRLLIGFALVATVSAAASLFPKDSMDLLGAEILPYAGLFIIAARIGAEWARAPWLYGWRASAGIMGAVATAFLLVLLLFYGPAGFREWAVAREFFRMDADAPDTWRLQFVFDHHNRAGFFLMVAAFVLGAVAAGRNVRRGWRAAAAATALAALFALPFTLTRGALVGAAAGAAVVALSAAVARPSRWMLGVAVVLMVLPWFFLPDSYQQHIRRLADPASYKIEGPGSISARFRMWDEAFSMIGKRPVLGFGYGFENFESAARHDHPEDPNYFKHAVHAHNTWLETAAETGLPGAVLLLAFTLIRWIVLARAWLRASRAGSGLAWAMLIWLGLEAAIFFYGLGNYALRRNLGFLVYGVWAGSLVLAALAANPKRAEAVKPATPC